MARLSTHVLDTSRGMPAAGVTVHVHLVRGDARASVAAATTNADGRTDAPLVSGERLETGIYELTFHVGEYFRGAGVALTDPPFLDSVVVRIGIADAGGSYHVPLLISPYGYSTYRGKLMVAERARDIIRVCRALAGHSEEAGFTTRTFLSAPMRAVHADLSARMTHAGLDVRVDHAGNLRGVYAASSADAARLFIGSHLDTVPRAGAFDGILGVVIGIVLVEMLDRRRLPFSIEVVGFSEEEGVRFGVPFIGSRALAGTVTADLLGRTDDAGKRVSDAIREYGLDPSRIGEACAAGPAIGYLEFHIEQGPVLENLGLPLGIVDAIVGQSRAEVTFTGASGHAGTTPMTARRDALAGTAEWIGRVEREGATTAGLVATVGRIEASPGATNVIPGRCRASLDLRHADDGIRAAARDRLHGGAREIASRRGLGVHWEPRLEQPAVRMSASLVAALTRAVERTGAAPVTLASGAGHDAMILAERMPAAMLMIRSPGGLSHHPDESVAEDDVAAALAAGNAFLDEMARRTARD